MYRIYWFILFIYFFLLFGCALRRETEISKPPAETPKAAEAPTAAKPLAPKVVVRAVKSADGLTDGEIVGIPVPGSKFSLLKIGMTMKQVENLIGEANDTDSRITGKQFQPFYFGGDTQRTEAFYKNEGQLTFSNTLPESAANTLIRIVVNPDATGKK